jgi:hypothetical protein
MNLHSNYRDFIEVARIAIDPVQKYIYLYSVDVGNHSFKNPRTTLRDIIIGAWAESKPWCSRPDILDTPIADIPPTEFDVEIYEKGGILYKD